MTYKYNQLPPHVERLLQSRYYLRGESYENFYGKPGAESSWAEIAARVAKVVSANDPSMDAIYNAMIRDMQFIPNSPTLFGAGVPGLCLSACFVLPIEDSVEGWAEAIRRGLLVQTKGGGIGWPLHMLRPKGFPIRGKNAKAAGPLAFLRSWNQLSNEFRQGVRNGANMGMMMVNHPDIEEFIEAKEQDGDISSFNISVGVTDHFMAAAKTRDKFPLVWNGEVVKEINAGELLDRIAYLAWKNGEPGLLNMPRIAMDNLHPEHLLYVNPCAEATLPLLGACNLGSVNLVAVVNLDGTINYPHLRGLVRNAYQFLDDLIDVNTYPLPEIEEQVKKYRQIGLGVMGLATAMWKCGIRYGSPESEEFANRIFAEIRREADYMNEHLAEVRGAYPAATEKLRNSMMTTVAPTGSISLIAGVSGGIEPEFSFATIKREIAGQTEMFTPEKPEDESLAVTTMDVTWEQHIRMAAIAQEHTTMSVSKTINMPNSATIEDVKSAYLLAFKLGLKGITVYRDGSREGQVISVADREAPKNNDRPAMLQGVTHKEKIGCGNLYMTINHDNTGEVTEVFIHSGKLGGCKANIEAMARMVSTALRNGVPKEKVVRQLRGILCSSCLRSGVTALSCPDALARVLEGGKKMTQISLNEPASMQTKVQESEQKGKCPECGEKLRHEGGCVSCTCGYSKCG